MTAPTRELRRRNLRRLLNARHLAFVGGRQLEPAIEYCRRIGFTGEIWAVNPRYDSIGGIGCVPGVANLPCAPDGTMLAVSAERSVEIVAQLEALGAGGVICHAAGFAEMRDERVELQQALEQAAGGLALVGPNCMGLINYFDAYALWASDNHFTRAGQKGAALISQSGAVVLGITAVDLTVPLGYAISIGNQACLDFGDYIHATLDDERVNAIALYAEGVTDGPSLADALARAMGAGVPVVLLKGGGTPSSARASVSHTGALAVPDDFWRALIERYALIEVSTPKELTETLKLLVVAGPPPGNRILAASYSGAFCTMLSDRAPAVGLEFSQIPESGHDYVRRHLPAEVTVANPFDVNLPWSSSEVLSVEDTDGITECLGAVAGADTDCVSFFIDLPKPGRNLEAVWMPTIDAVVALKRQSDLTCVLGSIMPDGINDEIQRRVMGEGVPVLSGMAEGLVALSGACRYRARRALALELADATTGLVDCEGSAEGAIALDEYESRRRLSRAGVPFMRAWYATAEDAPQAARYIGFPVSVKVVSDRLLHKSRLGGVKLGVETSEAVEVAVTEIRDAVAAHLADVSNCRYLIEPMVTDGVAEVIVGIKRDPSLGLALVLGKGGTAVEIARDYTVSLLPLSDAAIAHALGRLSFIQDLREPGGAVENLTRAVRSVVDFAVCHAQDLEELDVNPVLVRATGDVVAVDALLVMRP